MYAVVRIEHTDGTISETIVDPELLRNQDLEALADALLDALPTAAAVGITTPAESSEPAAD